MSEDGLARLRDSAPDVCVLDLMLPGLSGWQVIEIARAEGISTPLIVVSARGSEVERNRALTLGASAYLIKPFPMRTLVAQVRTTLEGGRAGATSAAPTWLLPDERAPTRAGAARVSEPHEVADGYEQVVAGIYHWRIHNSSIGGATSSAHAVTEGETTVFIDPLQLAPAALAELPAPSAILLTARCHQRSAWRYRRQFGAEVWLPQDASQAECSSLTAATATASSCRAGCARSHPRAGASALRLAARASARGALLSRPRREQPRRRAAFHPLRVPRGSPRSGTQHRGATRAALRRALPRPPHAAPPRRPEGCDQASARLGRLKPPLSSRGARASRRPGHGVEILGVVHVEDQTSSPASR